MGLPVLRALSLCTCCRHYPGAATGRRRRSSHPAVSAFPDNVVGSTCTLSFSRIAQRSLALRPAHSRGHLYVTCYTEGFSHFVTSMTAPVASGWSVRRVGLSPTGKRRLLTAHANSGHSGARGRCLNSTLQMLTLPLAAWLKRADALGLGVWARRRTRFSDVMLRRAAGNATRHNQGVFRKDWRGHRPS